MNKVHVMRFFQEKFPLPSVLRSGPEAFAQVCDEAIDAETLQEEILAALGFGRRDLCQFLGIGESTLSGWLKNSRVPKDAKLAMAVPYLLELIRNLERCRRDIKVLRDGDAYSLCIFRVDQHGMECGDVLARGIPSREHAELLASSERACRLVKDLADFALPFITSTSEEPSMVANAETLQERVRDLLRTIADPEEPSPANTSSDRTNQE